MTKHKTSKRRFRGFLIALLVLSPFLLLGGVHVWGYVKVQVQVRATRKAGDPATLQDLDDLAQQIPIQEEAAAFYEEVFSCLVFDNMNTKLRNQLPSAWRIESGEQAWPLPEKDRQWLQEMLEADHEALAMLQEAPTIQGRVFDISYADWVNSFSTRMEPLHRVVDLLTLNAIYAANKADATTVAESLGAALRVAETLREEPFAFSQGHRQGLIDRVLRTCAWSSSVVKFSKDQQKRLDQQLIDIQWPMALRDRLVNMRCAFRGVYRRPTPEILMEFGFSKKIRNSKRVPIDARWITAFEWSGLLRHSEALFLRQSEQIIGASLKWKPGGWASIRGRFASTDQPRPVTLIPMFLSYTESECVRPLRIRARRQVLRCVLAARQYQQQTGRWAQTLGELVPDYLDGIPADPFTGTPLQYQLRQGGRAIFSVGRDLQASQERYFRDDRNQQTSDDIITWLEPPEENPDRERNGN
jgi:hypothetical protein